MPSTVRPRQDALALRFGGGINSSASEDEIQDTECSFGQNFTLDVQNREFRPRKPFELVATATNEGPIRGFAQLLKRDGSTSTLVQAGTKVYEWDGTPTGFTDTSVTVSATARLRGHLWHNYTLDEVVLITDLSLEENVMQWDGTTLADVTFTGASNFKARYCFVDQERAFYANIFENATAVPHMIVASEIEDYNTVSVVTRPDGSLNEADPIYLLTPDLRPVNALVNAFGKIVLSSREGSIFMVSGSSAKDYSVDSLYPRSFASGLESMAFIGNDIAYGRPGRIESLLSTDRFGNVETDDLSLEISNLIENEKEWQVVYNGRLDRAYFFPSETNRIWVLHKSLIDSDVSPWSLWTTQSGVSLSPSAAMSFLDPQTGLEHVWFGDTDGNIYRLDGVASGLDAGIATINCTRTSKLLPMNLDTEATYVEGYIKYRRQAAASVGMNFLWGGQSLSTSSVVVDIPAPGGRVTYGGDFYYADGNYYGSTFSARIVRQKFGGSGRGTDLQIETSVDSGADFAINEIFIRYKEVQK
jgi:hypothetical protein